MNNKEVNEKIDKIIKELVAVRRLIKQGEKPITEKLITEKPITKKELFEKVKKLFILDKVELCDDYITISSTYNKHNFTNNELQPLFELSRTYNFKIAMHEKDEFETYTTIMLRLNDSSIIL